MIIAIYIIAILFIYFITMAITLKFLEVLEKVKYDDMKEQQQTLAMIFSIFWPVFWIIYGGFVTGGRIFKRFVKEEEKDEKG